MCRKTHIHLGVVSHSILTGAIVQDCSGIEDYVCAGSCGDFLGDSHDKTHEPLFDDMVCLSNGNSAGRSRVQSRPQNSHTMGLRDPSQAVTGRASRRVTRLRLLLTFMVLVGIGLLGVVTAQLLYIGYQSPAYLCLVNDDPLPSGAILSEGHIPVGRISVLPLGLECSFWSGPGHPFVVRAPSWDLTWMALSGALALVLPISISLIRRRQERHG